MLKSLYSFLILLSSYYSFSQENNVVNFKSTWPKSVTRFWVGPEYWTNRLQDWQINKGRLECLVSSENRNVHLLNVRLSNKPGSLQLKVNLGFIHGPINNGWAGFIIGARGEFNDYRDDAVYGTGLEAGILTSGKLFIGKVDSTDYEKPDAATVNLLLKNGIELKLGVTKTGSNYKVSLTSVDAKTGRTLSSIEKDNILMSSATGNLALKVHFPPGDSTKKINLAAEKKNGSSFWFRDWIVKGDKVTLHPKQTFGPILWSQYTASKGILNLTAQMAPVALKKGDDLKVKLQVGGLNGKWRTISVSAIQPNSRVAKFRIPNWDQSMDVPYRLAYTALVNNSKLREFYWGGIVRKDPINKKEIVVAAFTGNTDLGFPNNEIVKHVKAHNPDLLVFTGDQLYEVVGGYGIQSSPVEMAYLDYLRKWYMYGWEYRDLLKDIPSVAIPDDHDVYQGNIWGAGGKPASTKGDRMDNQDSGGFTMPPEWVNMVQETQTANLPDPYDPTPVQQNIGVYYCDLQVGGVSFAIIEDRKWKSAPKTVLPLDLNILNGFSLAGERVDPKLLDNPKAELLGERQIAFLKNWASDWSGSVWFKSLISQTIFVNLATTPNPPAKKFGGKNGKPVQDMDSNGWPSAGRNKAIEEIRKAFAFHIAGDQHLGSTVQYGVDEWGDAGYAICVPSISNYFPRAWNPEEGGMNRKPGAPKYTGDFLDGFGNKMTVLAVSNPKASGLKPERLYDRAAGYGIIKFKRETREIELANWARQTDPSQQGAKPFEGWPITIKQQDNYGRKAVAYLPGLVVTGLKQFPVIQVIDEQKQEIVYTIRATEKVAPLKVFKESVYTIKVISPELGQMKSFTGLRANSISNAKEISVVF